MRARKLQETIQTYLVSVGSIYLFAFASLYLQVPGLYGRNGLLPVQNVVHQLEGNQSIADHVKTGAAPYLLMYFDRLGIPPDYMMELLCLVGVILSTGVIMFTAIRSSIVFLVLWALYLSLVKVGQTFLHFQWDTLLLETGVITVLVAPLNVCFWKRPIPKPHDVSSLWLVRWLLFRLMFASGVVKLTSQCPTWWGLTALNWHYESQCIPTPLAWYAHQLPEWFLKLSVIGTYYIEILVPFLFFVPVRSLRLFSFWCQVFFQVCIILTGNYNFFNLLTIVLCVSLLDDDCFVTKRRTKRVTLDWTRKLTNWVFGKRLGRIVHGLVRLILFVGGIFGLGAVCWYWFELKIEGYHILSKTVFSSDEFSFALSYAVPAAACMGGISLVLELLYAVWDSLDVTGLLNKIWSFLQTLLMGVAITGLFSVSLISHGALYRPFNSKIPEPVVEVYRATYPFQVTNSYGLFRSMTGVGGRPELIIEGSNSETDHWKEYNFFYKPGDVTSSPLYILPHQPRLDWQMWFAAFGSHQQNPWIVSLVYRLLKGQKEVMEIMAPPPFEKPPRYIRVSRYTYHYTSYDYNKSLVNQSGPWWTREYVDEYLFSLSLDHKGLLDFVDEHKFTSKSELHYCRNPMCLFLDHIRKYSRVVRPHELLWMLFVTISIIGITMKYISRMFNSTRQGKKKEPIANNNTTTTTITTDNTNTGKTTNKKKSNSKKKNASKTDEKH